MNDNIANDDSVKHATSFFFLLNHLQIWLNDYCDQTVIGYVMSFNYVNKLCLVQFR